MSFYPCAVKTRFGFKNELIQALQEIYGKDSVEVHDVVTPLIDYRGNASPMSANIIVRRSHLGLASNDLGFVLVDGFYHAHISDFDGGTGDYSNRKKIVDIRNIANKYAMSVIKSRLPRKYIIMDTKEQNTIDIEQIY